MPASRTRKASGSSPTSASPGRPTAAIAVDRPLPQLYIGDKPFVPKLPPYKFQLHVDGRPRRAADRRQPEPERLHQPGAGMGHQQSDRRHRLEREEFRRRQQSVRRCLRHSRHRPGEPGPDLAVGAAHRVPRADGRQMVGLRAEHRARAERLSEAARTAAASSGRTRWCSATTAAPCTSSTTARSSPTSR